MYDCVVCLQQVDPFSSLDSVVSAMIEDATTRCRDLHPGMYIEIVEGRHATDVK